MDGVLNLDLGDESFVLGAGDSLEIDASEPHSFHNTGSRPAVGVWFVVDYRASLRRTPARASPPPADTTPPIASTREPTGPPIDR